MKGEGNRTERTRVEKNGQNGGNGNNNTCSARDYGLLFIYVLNACFLGGINISKEKIKRLKTQIKTSKSIDLNTPEVFLLLFYQKQ